MPRLLFKKTGNAMWISHLDLMRLFQRAFKRAGLPLTHTQGYNPRPSVSIALPMSVGVESVCELLDFDLEGETVSCDEIKDRLNQALVSGIQVREVYQTGRKLKELTLLRSRITLEYGSGIPLDTVSKISELFHRGSLSVPKKTKNGVQEQEILSMIREITVDAVDINTVVIDCLANCQNPTLNPMQLPLAIEMYLPECRPDFSHCMRLEIYDSKQSIFR